MQLSQIFQNDGYYYILKKICQLTLKKNQALLFAWDGGEILISKCWKSSQVYGKIVGRRIRVEIENFFWEKHEKNPEIFSLHGKIFYIQLGSIFKPKRFGWEIQGNILVYRSPVVVW